MTIYSALGSNEINEDIKSTMHENQLEDVPVEELDATDIEISIFFSLFACY